MLLNVTAPRWLAAAFLCVVSTFTRADILSASIDYHSGEYQKAYQSFYQLAQLGNKDAIYNIAVMYLHGQGREQDYTQAYAWFRLAVEFGLSDASSAIKLIKTNVDDVQVLDDAYQQLQQTLSFAQFHQTLAPQFIHDSATVLPLVQYSEPKYPQGALNQGLEG